MKITVKRMAGDDIEFKLDSNANIRQLRNKLATEFKEPWDWIEIVNIKDKDNERLCPIYSDDSSDEDLVNFIRKEVNKPDLVIDELVIYVRLNLGAGFFRPTKHNPCGRSAGEELIDDQDYKFFKAITNPDQKESFSNRLKKINFPIENVPENFLDPITCEVMDDPVITSSQRTFDLKVLRELEFIDPSSKQEITVSRPNLQLRSALEEFVAQKEKATADILCLLVQEFKKMSI